MAVAYADGELGPTRSARFVERTICIKKILQNARKLSSLEPDALSTKDMDSETETEKCVVV